MLPPVLHALQGAFVRFIAPGNHLLQMAVLRFYYFISLISME